MHLRSACSLSTQNSCHFHVYNTALYSPPLFESVQFQARMPRQGCSDWSMEEVISPDLRDKKFGSASLIPMHIFFRYIFQPKGQTNPCILLRSTLERNIYPPATSKSLEHPTAAVVVVWMVWDGFSLSLYPFYSQLYFVLLWRRGHSGR